MQYIGYSIFRAIAGPGNVAQLHHVQALSCGNITSGLSLHLRQPARAIFLLSYTGNPASVEFQTSDHHCISDKISAGNIPTVKMAEALGLASSIVALVQLSASVYSATSKFYRQAKEAKSKISALATQTRNLSGVLHSLSLLTSAPLFDDVGAAVPDFRDTYIDSCRTTLHNIKRKLEKAEADLDSGSHKRLITRSLKWPFDSQETTDLITELSQHQNILQLALSAETMSHLLQCLANTNSIAKSIDGLHRKVDRKASIDTRAELTARRKEIVQFFLKVNPEQYLQDCRKRRQENTGRWLVERDQTFRDWIDSTGSQIWLSGIPGKIPYTV